MNFTTIHQEAPPAWAEKHFGEVDLGDPRRNQRAGTIATAMAINPQKSIPQIFIHRSEIKAAYTLFRHPEATPENLQDANGCSQDGVLPRTGRDGLWLSPRRRLSFNVVVHGLLRKSVSEGEVLRFKERYFLPYHGGHTIVFEGRSLYLQEVQNEAILANFSEYITRIA